MVHGEPLPACLGSLGQAGARLPQFRRQQPTAEDPVLPRSTLSCAELLVVGSDRGTDLVLEGADRLGIARRRPGGAAVFVRGPGQAYPQETCRV